MIKTKEINKRWTCRAKQSKRYTRNIGPSPGDELWLIIEPEFGYIQWSPNKPEQGFFKTANEALVAAKANNGMPWYYQPDMRTLKPVCITIETTITIMEN